MADETIEIEEHAKIVMASVMMFKLCIDGGDISKEMIEEFENIVRICDAHERYEKEHTEMSEEYKKNIREMREMVSDIKKAIDKQKEKEYREEMQRFAKSKLEERGITGLMSLDEIFDSETIGRMKEFFKRKIERGEFD